MPVLKTLSKTFGVRVLALSVSAILFSGCQAGYLLKSAYSQADLLRRRIPLEEALNSSQISEESKRKLRLAQEARIFSEKELGLKPTQNYTTYVQLDRPYVTYVVSAAEKNKLEHYLWSYPLVGSLPYKGFFDPEDAKVEAASLKNLGLDTYIRGVSAYSTLGWFRDPLLSSMLDYEDYDLVNTVIHETVHATVFINSAADFNETLASFIGNKGTEAFYLAKEGADGPTLKAMQHDAEDERLFSVFISKELDDLRAWYEERKDQEISEDVRKARLQEIQDRFANELRPKFKLERSYRSFLKSEINNARLLTYKLYMEDMADFEIVFQKLGGDFKRMIEFAKALEDIKDPKAELVRVARQP